MFKPFDLSGKAALVTGGNGGIGLGMAEGLAAAGADVEIWGQNEAKSKAAAENLKAHGRRVSTRRVDVSNEDEVVAGVKAAIAELGRLDTVIANAGMGIGGPVTEMTTDAFRRVHTVNEDAVFWTFREAARHMIARAEKGDAGGSMIAVSSTSAIHGAARNCAYGASKGAVLSLVRALGVELARYKIRVNAVAPGWTRTEMTQRAQDSDKFNEKVISRVPIGGWAEPEDFSGIAVYLASDASRFHTADTIVIDGGYVVF
jgi:NAD(P)-dependent dehydrogenase (short-subunit alcohol dehydrogenase family)